MRLKLILTVGVANSSKTTWAETYCREHPDTVNLSRDHYRYGIYSNSDLPKEVIEKEITWNIFNDFNRAILAGNNVIISDGNLSRRSRSYWQRVIGMYGIDLEYVVFQSAFNDIFFKNSEIHLLPQHVLVNQYNNYMEFINSTPNPKANYKFI